MKKKNSVRKKTKAKKVKSKKSKKLTVRKTQSTQGVTAVIPYTEIEKIETYHGKYTIVPTAFNETQIKAILAPAPEDVIKTRPGKGGGNWRFIPGWWFKKKLNFIFGFDGWDTVIDGERIDGKFITVKGRLVIKGTKNRKELVSKSDFGGAEIKFLKGTKDYLDISNDFKTAQTDLIKRCCVQLGFAMNVYATNESMTEGFQVEEPKVIESPKQNNGNPVIEAECHGCANPITKEEAEYSKKMFKKQLCRDCQNEKRGKK